MMGRPNKPTALKTLEGNPGKRPLNENEPKPEPGLPDPPPSLCDIALAEWNERGPGLARIGVITEVDAAIFAAYCQAFADWTRARRGLQSQMERWKKIKRLGRGEDGEDEEDGEEVLTDDIEDVKLKDGDEVAVESYAYMVRTRDGGWKRNPLLIAANDASQLMIRYAGEIGLTPAARARLEVQSPEEVKKSKIKALMYKEKTA